MPRIEAIVGGRLLTQVVVKVGTWIAAHAGFGRPHEIVGMPRSDIVQTIALAVVELFGERAMHGPGFVAEQGVEIFFYRSVSVQLDEQPFGSRTHVDVAIKPAADPVRTTPVQARQARVLNSWIARRPEIEPDGALD